MTNKEKVIKGLNCCAHTDENSCIYCPYDNTSEDCTVLMLMDAIALLKEQEAVVPILIREGRNKNYNDYVCPRCDNVVVYEQNYCSECGVKFMWEGR